MPARVEKIAREQLRMQLPSAARTDVVALPGTSRRRRDERRAITASARQRAPRNRDAAPLALPRFRAPLVFGALALLFAVLLGRSLYLQWFDNEFLQGQGSARHSRELEVPAHRGRIVDRTGEALALSTPVKSLWAFPDKFDATPEQIAALARDPRDDAADGSARGSTPTRTSRSSRKQIAAGDRGARDGAAHSRACTTRTNIAASIPAAK